jgi:hypothetical protein
MSFSTGAPSPYCGRLDPHAAHEWLGQDWPNATSLVAPRIIRECPGRPVIEGGNPAAQRWPR